MIRSSTYGLMNGSSMTLSRFARNVRSNLLISLFWYASTKSVMACISGSDRYGFVSCALKGSTWLSMSILANTRYFRHCTLHSSM